MLILRKINLENGIYGKNDGEDLILWKTCEKMLILGKANLENGDFGED